MSLLLDAPPYSHMRKIPHDVPHPIPEYNPEKS